jgi:hypothetical protein
MRALKDVRSYSMVFLMIVVAILSSGEKEDRLGFMLLVERKTKDIIK